MPPCGHNPHAAFERTSAVWTKLCAPSDNCAIASALLLAVEFAATASGVDICCPAGMVQLSWYPYADCSCDSLLAEAFSTSALPGDSSGDSRQCCHRYRCRRHSALHQSPSVCRWEHAQPDG